MNRRSILAFLGIGAAAGAAAETAPAEAETARPAEPQKRFWHRDFGDVADVSLFHKNVVREAKVADFDHEVVKPHVLISVRTMHSDGTLDRLRKYRITAEQYRWLEARMKIDSLPRYSATATAAIDALGPAPEAVWS